MANSLGMVIDAIKARYTESTRDRKLFKSRQDSLFNEGIIQFKLREQLQSAINQLSDDPNIKSIRVQVVPEAIPFVGFVLQSLNCEYEMCPEPDQIILTRQVVYL